MAFDRAKALELIQRNITKHGLHVYSVAGGVTRFTYSIGLTETNAPELVLAGTAYEYDAQDCAKIVNTIAKLRRDTTPLSGTFTVDKLGTFSLRPAHPSWVQPLLLGATDYYRGRAVQAVQLVPDEAHWTIDVPDMTRENTAANAPIWHTEDNAWPHPVSRESTIAIDVDALRGAPIMEAARWEDDYWEAFSAKGQPEDKDDGRFVPLEMILAFDPTLEGIVQLPVGKGMWREAVGGVWKPMGSGK